MKTDGWKFLGIFLFLIGVVTGAPGLATAQKAPRFLTLEQCIRLALERNLAVRAQQEGVGAAEEKAKSAGTAFFPRLSLEANYTRLSEAPSAEFMGSTVEMGNDEFHSGKLALEQPLFTGWAVTNQFKLADAGSKIEQIQMEIVERDLELQVTRAYFGVLSAMKFRDVAAKAVELIEAHLKTAREFYEVGSVPKSDVLKAEVELANARQNLIKADSDLDLAEASLNSILNFPIDDEILLDDILEYRPVALDFQKAIEQALIYRPEIRQMDLRSRQADLGVSLAKSGWYPQLFLIGDYTLESEGGGLGGSEAGDWTVGVVASWTFWDWGQVRHDVREASRSRAQTGYLLEQTREAIRLEVKQALLRLQVAGKKIGVAEKAIEQAEENLRIATERYSASVATSTEVLDAETLLTTAMVNYNAALYDYNIALAELRKSTGIAIR